MSSRDDVALALASAFIASDWTETEMIALGAEVVRGSRPWMRRLVRAARRVYRRPPRDRVGELAAWIALRGESLRPVRERRARIVRERDEYAPYVIVRWIVAPSQMRELVPWPVARIDTVGDLGAWLGVAPTTLDWLADRRAMLRRAREERLHHYRRVWVAKRSPASRALSGARLLEAPKSGLRAVQRAILDGILAHVPQHDASHGFRRGRDVGTFVLPHVGRALVLRMDLEDFFASVDAGRVFGIFRSAGYAEEVARTLTALCTTRTPSHVLRAAPRIGDLPARARAAARLRELHLPQGSPSSPALASLSAFRLDARLESLAIASGARYTRYADDLAFSFDGPRAAAAIDRFIALTTHIAREEGFGVAAHKTRVMRRGARQHLAGLVLNERPAAPREEYERLRAILHLAARTGPDAQNREAHPDFRAHLRGRIEWIASWTPARGAKLMRLFAAIEWPG